MPTSIDLKPCSDCGDEANCALRELKAVIEIGEEQSISVPVPEGVRVSMSFKYKDGSAKQVFECTEGIVFPPGTLTVTQS